MWLNYFLWNTKVAVFKTIFMMSVGIVTIVFVLIVFIQLETPICNFIQSEARCSIFHHSFYCYIVKYT